DLAGRARAQPVEDRSVVLVDAELVRRPTVGAQRRLARAPRVLDARVEARAREVEPVRAAVAVDDLGLQPREEPQRLRVALEPADVHREVRERALAVVAERGVPEVVREARGVDDVRVAPERLADLAAHLRYLERVRESRAHAFVAARTEHMLLG